jgi:hypothetical protein
MRIQIHIQLIIKVMRNCNHRPKDPQKGLHCESPRLQIELQAFHLDADPDLSPAIYLNTDPDPAFHFIADPDSPGFSLYCGSGFSVVFQIRPDWMRGEHKPVKDSKGPKVTDPKDPKHWLKLTTIRISYYLFGSGRPKCKEPYGYDPDYCGTWP